MRKKIAYYYSLLSVLSSAKLWNLILIYSSYYFSVATKKTVHKGEPWSLSIETGTHCNLSCLECLSGQNTFSRPTGSLSLHNFKTIIKKQKKYLIWLILYFQGEPFLNKQFFKMVKYAHSQKIFTTTSTNGHFLNKENAKKTVESGLNRIMVSLDGLDHKTFKKYRVGGEYKTVIEGIKNLVNAKKELHSHTPFIVVQFIVFKTNEHQLGLLKNLKSELQVDKIETKTAQIYSPKDKNQLIPEHATHRRYEQSNDGTWLLKKKLTNKCKRMWRASVITWDGQVVPCCFDKDADFQMGNLLNNSFQNIKNNREYKSFRNQVFSKRNAIKICKNCSEGL